MQRPAIESGEVSATLARLDRHLDRFAACGRHGEKQARRRIDQAEARAAVLDQGDVDGKVGALLDELLGAVERIDQEEARAERRRAIGGNLLRHHRNVRGEPMQGFKHDRL